MKRNHGKASLHGLMAEFDPITGQCFGMLGIIKVTGMFEIWNMAGKSICGRHLTMEAAINASLAYDTGSNEKGSK
jgi:hypothetical protein